MPQPANMQQQQHIGTIPMINAMPNQQQQQQQQSAVQYIIQPTTSISQQNVLAGKPFPATNTLYQQQAAAQQQLQQQQQQAAAFLALPHIHTAPMQQTSTAAAATYPQLTGITMNFPMVAANGSAQSIALPTILSQPANLSNAFHHSMGAMPLPHNPALTVSVPVSGQHKNRGSSANNHATSASPFGEEDKPSSSHSANTSAGLGSDGSPQIGGSGGTPGSSGGNKSRYRGVSYDRKKAKWRVQIKVAALGKSGVSVGYFDTEEAAARAYDRAAIGLLGRDNPNLQTNFELTDYAEEPIPRLTGKSREEVKTTLKSERIKQAPRRRFTSRQRTSRFMGVGSSNRKNQWQARILVHGKVTHLGYYETEEEAARVYDRVSLALHGDHAQTNFPSTEYHEAELSPYRGLDREDLQRALGVKPMDKSSRYRGVSKKKGKWEAKVMVNRRWAYRELFDSEEEAARAYDRALWRLKPREARSYVNFKDEIPADLEGYIAAAAAGVGRYGGGSDADHLDSDGGYGGIGTASDGSDDGDFEYEYKPTKGTLRSASMRAKRAGSAPNLAAAVAASRGGRIAASNSNRQPATANHSAQASHGTGPSFVALPGGGLQLQFGSTNLPPIGMIPDPTLIDSHTATTDESLLLIRVGSETHVLPTAPPAVARQTLGKRTGLQRIHSEPQFSVATRETSPDDGFQSSDIHDLMNDKDLFFKGVDLSELAAAHPGSGNQANDLNLMDLPSMAELMQTDTASHSMNGDIVHDLNRDDAGDMHGRAEGFGGLLFEDEDMALANVEFSRPKKMSKSMSMGQLSSLREQHEASMTVEEMHHRSGLYEGNGKPPLHPGSAGSSPTHRSIDDDRKIGPLGQPIRRINTFTSSLPSFEETVEDVHAHGGTAGGGTAHQASTALMAMRSQHSSEEDLVKQLLAPGSIMMENSPFEGALRLLDDTA